MKKRMLAFATAAALAAIPVATAAAQRATCGHSACPPVHRQMITPTPIHH